MHQLMILGEVPSSRRALEGAIVHLQHECHIMYEKHMDTDPEDAWAGPLQDIPDGTYALWQGDSSIYSLWVYNGQIFFDGKLIADRRARGDLFIPLEHLTTFQSMLESSSKQVWAYRDADGNYQYALAWQGDIPPDIHAEYEQHKRIGKVNMINGRIDKDDPGNPPND